MRRWTGSPKLGYDPLYGARPLKRVIRKQLEDPLAAALLGGEVVDGQAVTVDVEDDGSFRLRSTGPATRSPAAGSDDVEVVGVQREV